MSAPRSPDLDRLAEALAALLAAWWTRQAGTVNRQTSPMGTESHTDPPGRTA